MNCVCHSIRSMFRVLGIYNFGSDHKRDIPEHCTLTLSAAAPSVIPMYFVDMTNQNSYRFPAFTFQLSQSIFPKKN